MRARLPLLWAVLAGCGAGDVVLPLPPDLPDAGAVLFVVEPATGPVELHAQPAASARLELTTRRDGQVRITALSYASTLADLGLEAGPVALEAPEVCGAQPLPPQDGLHQVRIGAEVEAAWEAISVRSEAVDGVRLPGACPCHRFEVLDARTPPVALAALWAQDDGTATVIDARGAFWRMDSALGFTPLAGTSTAPVEDLRQIEAAPDGRIWLSIEDELWRGTMQDGFARRPVRQPATIRSLASGPGADGFEVFGANEAGELWRFEPEPAVRWARPLHVPFIPTQIGRVVWLGPGRVVATEHAAYDVFWMVDGVETGRVELPPDSGGAALLRDIPGVGLVTLTNSARLFRVAPDLVETLAGAPDVTPPRTMLPFRGGLLYTGNTGYLQEYQPDYGFCPTQQLDGEPRVLAIVRLWDRLAAVALEAGAGREQQVLLLDPVTYGRSI